MVFAASLLGAQHVERIVWRTSRQVWLLCFWARHLMGRLHLYLADRWPSRTSPDYNCEVANLACQTTLGYPPVAVRLVGGGATRHSWLVRNGLPSSPSLISIRLTAWIWIAIHAVPPSRGRGGVTTNKHLQSLGFTPSLAKPEMEKEVGRRRARSKNDREKWVRVTREKPQRGGVG